LRFCFHSTSQGQCGAIAGSFSILIAVAAGAWLPHHRRRL
jgi:hypothetical protein